MGYIGNMGYIIGVILFRVNGKENGSYYSVIGFGRVSGIRWVRGFLGSGKGG